MDCCSKYPTDYTRPCHHTIPPVGGISGSCNSNSIMSNTNLYGPRIVHPSLRYQSTLNRNGYPPPIGYDGFGPPPPPPPTLASPLQPTATLGNVLPPHPYQNYDLRYDPNSRTYSNFVSSNGSTPLYPYSNSNGFSYGHLNNRFYNHHYHHPNHHHQPQQQQQQQHQHQQQHYYDSYGRIIGANHPYPYQHHHNYHTIRNSGNLSNLNGSNSAYHHVYGHRQNSPYHPLRALDYHTPQSTSQYYPSHHTHHQHNNSLHHHNQNGNTLQHFNSSLYPSHTLSSPHNDILQSNYSAQQSEQSLQNNLIMKDSMFLPHITNDTSPSTEHDDSNRYSSVNGLNRETTDIDCDGIIDINSNSDKEISGRCNSTQSIVNSPSENSSIINTNNNNDGTIYNSELTVPSSPLTNGSADSGISGCGNISDSLYQNNNKNCTENYDNDNIGQLENENENEKEETCENKQNIEKMISTNDNEHQDIQSSDVDSTDLKERKSELKNNLEDSEKLENRTRDTNKRKLDCSTPLINTSPPIHERSATPFVHHQQQYYHQQQQPQQYHHNNQSRYLNSSPATNQNNNYSSYYQNYYTQSNRTNWSPYSSPHYNYPYSNYSPKPISTIKTSSTTSPISAIRNKRTFSQQITNNRRRKTQQLSQQRKKPISKPPTSSLLTTTRNKNRVLECDFIPSKKSKRKNQSESEDSFEFREEIKDIKPLPGFQQAFGSTEIGRFSEIFFNTPSDSPYDNIPYGYESEADTSMSPYPWETGDSLEGPPHYNLHIGAASLKSCYTDHLNSIINNDSLLLENNNYFSGIRCSEY